MKKILCLTLSLLLCLPLLAGCNDAAFITDPAGKSESAAGSPSGIESEGKDSANAPFAPEERPTSTPAPSYPELPFAVDEIFWGGELVQNGTSTINVSGVNFLNNSNASDCKRAKEDQPVAFYLSLNLFADLYRAEYPEMLSQLENAKEHPEGITYKTLLKDVFDENGVYDAAKGEEWISDLRFAISFYQDIRELGRDANDLMKADWKQRCADKGITCVDIDDSGLYIFCTRDQLASMVKKEEARFPLYELQVSTQNSYSAKRQQIVS